MEQKKIIISSLSSALYTTKRLMTEAQGLGLDSIYLNPMNFSTHNLPQFKEATYFHRISGTNYDDFDLLVAQCFKDQGHRITNPLENLNIFRNKDLQSLFLKRHKIPSIDSLCFRGEITPELMNGILALPQKDSSNKDAFILKTSRGNQGVGVNFIQGEKSLRSLLETFYAMKDQKFLIQAYVPHQREWRFLILNNEILAIIEKQLDPNDFRGNSKRSLAKLVTNVPLALTELAAHAFKSSQLDYAGIDILETIDGEFLVLEINAVCGFEQVESLSKLNVAREFILKLQ